MISGMRPPSGSHASAMAKASWSSKPTKKRGIEMAASPSTVLTKSGQRLTLTADMTPSGIPTRTVTMMVAITSSSVAGRKVDISSKTGRRVKIDVPQSP